MRPCNLITADLCRRRHSRYLDRISRISAETYDVKVAATSVSPIQLSHLTCAQIREEAGRVSARAAQAVGPQDEKRRSDQVATTVGAVIVLPALLFIDGDNHQTAELTRRKGAVKALEQASVEKRCGLDFEPQPPRR